MQILLSVALWIRDNSAKTKQTTNSVAFSPQANSTDRAAIVVGEVSANFCEKKCAACSGQRVSTAVNLDFFYTGSATFSFK
jgi:hypothetical protein